MKKKVRSELHLNLFHLRVQEFFSVNFVPFVTPTFGFSADTVVVEPRSETFTPFIPSGHSGLRPHLGSHGDSVKVTNDAVARPCPF